MNIINIQVQQQFIIREDTFYNYISYPQLARAVRGG